jgi:hypothetical protein
MVKQRKTHEKTSKKGKTSQYLICKYTNSINQTKRELDNLETYSKQKKTVLEKDINDCKQKYVEKTRRKESLASEIKQQTEKAVHLDIDIDNTRRQLVKMEKEKATLIENTNTKISEYRMCDKFLDEEYPEILSKNTRELAELNSVYKAEKKKLTQAIRYREKEIIFQEHNLRCNFDQERHEEPKEQPRQVQILITDCFAN